MPSDGCLCISGVFTDWMMNEWRLYGRLLGFGKVCLLLQPVYVFEMCWLDGAGEVEGMFRENRLNFCGRAEILQTQYKLDSGFFGTHRDRLLRAPSYPFLVSYQTWSWSTHERTYFITARKKVQFLLLHSHPDHFFSVACAFQNFHTFSIFLPDCTSLSIISPISLAALYLMQTVQLVLDFRVQNSSPSHSILSKYSII